MKIRQRPTIHLIAEQKAGSGNHASRLSNKENRLIEVGLSVTRGPTSIICLCIELETEMPYQCAVKRPPEKGHSQYAAL